MRLLLVEDDPTIAGFIAKGLKEAGFAVDHASDGEAGFELAVFVHAVVGAGRAAFHAWADRHPDDHRTDAAVTDLQRHLTVALEQLRHGFPALRDLTSTSVPQTRES